MKNILIFCVLTIAFSNLSAQWEPDVRLTLDDSSSYTPAYNNGWCISATGDSLHTVWYDKRNGGWEIYYKASFDNGSTWQTDVRLTDVPGRSESPSIAACNSNIHVVWDDARDGNFEIYCKNSTDGGSTWGADARLTNNSSISKCPTVASSDSIVHISWYEEGGGNSEIYYRRSTDAGMTWELEIRLTNDPGISKSPSIAISDSIVHIVWWDNRDGNEEIYYKCSYDYGITWQADTRLTVDTCGSYCPSISVSKPYVHVTWQDYRNLGFGEVYYKRSSDAGTTWDQDTQLTFDDAASVFPSIASSDSNVHLAWSDGRDGRWEIYYKCSKDAGITWEPDTRLTLEPSIPFSPFVAVSGSYVHVVWNDERDGNYEIYYKRNPTGNVLQEEEKYSQFGIENPVISPNPFTSSTAISLTSIGHSAEGIELRIYDLSGRLVKSINLKTSTYHLGADLVPGIYFLKLNDKPVGKVVKVR